MAQWFDRLGWVLIGVFLGFLVVEWQGTQEERILLHRFAPESQGDKVATEGKGE
jgi:hypothetical protein